MNLIQGCEAYISTNARIASPATERLLLHSCRQFDRWFGRPAELTDLTDVALTAFCRARSNQGAAPATVEREASKVATVWRWAAGQGLTKPPTIRIAKVQPDTPVAFLRWEIRALFRAARRSNDSVGGVAGRIFWPALLGVIWDTAERIGAVTLVYRSEIDVPGRWITFRQRKGGGRPTTRRLRRSTARAVRRLLVAHDAPQPFGHVHRTTLYYHVDRLLQEAGLPHDRRSKFHRLRRSHASYLHLAGGDSRESLGHSSEEITRERYYDPRVVHGRQPADLLFDPAGWFGRIGAWFGR